jgi:purine nucleosidase
MLVIDELGVWGKEPNAGICVEAEENRFKELVFRILEEPRQGRAGLKLLS